jgi:ankyrin repeat protein
MLLIRLGLDVNSKDVEGGTPLMGACLKGFLTVVKYLVDTAHADIFSKTKQGVSTLHRACDGGSVEVLEYLCDKGMVPSERDSEKRYVISRCFICLVKLNSDYLHI